MKGDQLSDNIRIRKTQCESCVFRPEQEGGIYLSPFRRVEIVAYLLQGTNQLCHHDEDRTVCRGGRDYQLQCWHRMGMIEEPTDEALREAMREVGVEPKRHV